jgi:predicted PurR-regulated permease PerM
MPEPVPTPPPPGGWRAEIAFLRRVLIAAGIAVLLLLAWAMQGALLLAFGAVVVATILTTAARPFHRHLGLSEKRALLVEGLGIVLLLGLVRVQMGTELRTQVAELSGTLPQAVQELAQRFGIELPGGEGNPLETSTMAGVLQEVAGFGRLLLDALSALALAVVGGAYLAADPRGHVRGLVKLVPQSQQARAEDAISASGTALRLWLTAQLVSMAIVGLLVGLGCWALGLPAPLALGLFAALAEFVPVLGAVIGAVPALTLDGATVLWVAALFLAVQQIESNELTPLIQQKMAEIPPAVLLFAAVAFGAVFGLPGVILAAPLAVVASVLVQKLYVRQTLGEEVEVPGEANRDA